MLLGQIRYHSKAKNLPIMNPAIVKFGRWAVAMETAPEVQICKFYILEMVQLGVDVKTSYTYSSLNIRNPFTLLFGQK